ncbi:MAG: YlbF family regulator [Verrucomicrobiales bacterium]|nr:YlbF family regulator [Verrucomicrobiales bacterium]
MTNGSVLAKTLELCQTIVDQQDFQALRRDVDAFMADESAQSLYRNVAERGESLHHKQQQGAQLDPEEVNAYETERQTLLGNEVARRFLDAQEQMHGIQQNVTRYVMKTLEIGRVPGEEDFQSCGHGCSCGH